MRGRRGLFTGKSKITELKLPLSLRLLRKLSLPKKLGFLGQLYGASLSDHGVVWVQTCAGPKWKLDLRNSTHRWILFGNYEGPDFIPWARRWLREDSVVVDSGANIGQVLLYLAPQIKTGRYLAFEPFPPARQWLKECLQNYPEWPVQVEEFGLGEKVGTASLEGQWGGEEAVGSHTELKIGQGNIQITSLDEYAEKNKIEKIRLWKLDMEGAEEAALRGARHLLERQRIEALVLEADQERFGNIADMLRGYGYFASYWNGEPMNEERVGSYVNILFRPQGAFVRT